MFIGNLYVFGLMSVYVFCPFFFFLAVSFSYIELHELLIYFGDQSFVSCFLCNYLLPFWVLSFHLAYCFIWWAKCFKFYYIPLVYLCFYFHYSRRWVKDLLWFMSKSVLPLFSSKSFIVYGFTVKSLIHFEFIFMYGIRKCLNFILLHVVHQFSQHHLWKRLSFLHCTWQVFQR